MIKKRKRRLNFSKVAKQPKLKKELSMFLAEYEVATKDIKYNVVDLLAYGHRGYVSHDERYLTKKFEQAVSDLETRKQTYEENKKNKPTWMGEQRWNLQPLLDKSTPLMQDLMDEVLLGDLL